MELQKPTRESFEPICAYVCDTYVRRKEDEKTPEELRSVMKEFSQKSQALLNSIEDADEDKIKECIIEVDQAADSAKRAADASSEASDSLVRQIEDAHNKVREFKDQTIH